jgi:UDP-3-O-[3-hydroxymyristoyl] glucosamine N-acyltransferase
MTPDPRFYEALGPLGLGELAALAGAKLAQAELADRQILGVAILARARRDTVSFLTDASRLEALRQTDCGACFVRPAEAAAVPEGCAALVTPTPQAAYAKAAARLHRPRQDGPEPAVEAGAVIGPGVVLGSGVQIGRGTVIGANAVIGAGVAIGRDCVIGAGAVIGFALVGDRVRILAGAVVGEPGFGAAAGESGLVDMPQLGRVILQDGVTLGANSCVDRGAFEDTVVGENSKIDNLVHIAHNVRVGRNCAMAAYTGISGSVVIGDGVQFGGKAGVADHVVIGDGAVIAADAAVMRDIGPGEKWGGSPARPFRQWMRETAWLSRAAARRKGTEG